MLGYLITSSKSRDRRMTDMGVTCFIKRSGRLKRSNITEYRWMVLKTQGSLSHFENWMHVGLLHKTHKTMTPRLKTRFLHWRSHLVVATSVVLFFSCTTCAWAMADSEMMQNALLQIFSMARSVGTREAMRPRLHLLPLHCLSCFQLLWRLSAAWWHQDKEIFLVMNDMERQDHHLDCWLPSYQSHTTKAELISTMLRVRYTRRKHHYCPIQIDSTVSVDPRTQQFYE